MVWDHAERSCGALHKAPPLFEPAVAQADSRRRLGVTFGLSLFIALGLYGMIQAYWLPWDMRGIHAVEVLVDSLVYGWLIVVLLVPSHGLHSRPLLQSAPAADGAAVNSE